MIYLITPNNYFMHRDDLDSMYKLRYKIFYEKLKWQVRISEGTEKDEYDEIHTVYLIFKDKNKIVRGCQRYINMAFPCMFDGPFDFVLPNLKKYKNANYWEASRLAVDYEYSKDYTKEDAQDVCARIFAASMLFGLEYGIKSFLTLSYPSVSRLLSQHFLTSQLAYSNINDEKIVVTEYPPDRASYAKLLAKINLPNNEAVYERTV